jgi:hypothetical protein
MHKTIVRSAGEALAEVRARYSAKLPTFPAKLWAEGHSPGKEPLMVQDEVQLPGAVTQAVYVSRDEFGKNGAVLEWHS